jgi:hypothetical protein
MEQLRVPRLLASALAAVSGAIVASFFGIEGTLIGAALVSLLVAPAEALYTHSLASAHRVARRSLVRRVGEQAGASEEDAIQADPQPIRWQRVAVAAVVAFGIAVGAITGVEAVAKQPLASLLGSRPRQGASTSVGVVVAGADRSASPATRAPATSTTSTSPSGPAPTTTAPVGVPTTTAPAGTVPSTTATTTATPSTQAPTTQRQ